MCLNSISCTSCVTHPSELMLLDSVTTGDIKRQLDGQFCVGGIYMEKTRYIVGDGTE